MREREKINICGCVSYGQMSEKFSVCLIYCKMLMVFDSIFESAR